VEREQFKVSGKARARQHPVPPRHARSAPPTSGSAFATPPGGRQAAANRLEDEAAALAATARELRARADAAQAAAALQLGTADFDARLAVRPPARPRPRCPPRR
jgi:hypothetical protein